MDGLISTIAGNGLVRGFYGDGSFANSSRMYDPRGVAVDSSTNIYISDTLNHVVRKISADGIIRTIAGKELEF